MDRRAQYPDRYALGWRRSQQGAELCQRADRHDTRRNRAQFQPCDRDRAAGNTNDPSRIRVRRRSRRERLCNKCGHPGGNLTGFPVFETAIAGKWVEIFHEAAPHVGRVAFIMVPETPAHVGFLRTAEAASLPLRVKLIALGVHTAAEIERAVSEFAREPNGGLIVVPHAVTVEHRNVILGLAAHIAFLRSIPYVTLPKMAA